MDELTIDQAIDIIRQAVFEADLSANYDSETMEFYVVSPIDGARHWGSEPINAHQQMSSELENLGKMIARKDPSLITIAMSIIEPDNVSESAVL